MPVSELPSDWRQKVKDCIISGPPTHWADDRRDISVELLSTREIEKAAVFLWQKTSKQPEIRERFFRVFRTALNVLAQAFAHDYQVYRRTRKEWRAIADALETVRDDGWFADPYGPSFCDRLSGNQIDPENRMDPKIRRILDVGQEKLKFGYLMLRETTNQAIKYYRTQAEKAPATTKPKDLAQKDALLNLGGVFRDLSGRTRNEVIRLLINAAAKNYPSRFSSITTSTIKARLSESRKNPLMMD